MSGARDLTAVREEIAAICARIAAHANATCVHADAACDRALAFELRCASAALLSAASLSQHLRPAQQQRGQAA